MPREAKSILCYVTDRRALAQGDARAGVAGDGAAEVLLAAIRRALAAGVDWIQIREKDLSARSLLALAHAAIEAGQRCGPARILINDRLDVSLAAGAAGVHLGEQSLPVAELVRWRREAARPEFLIGASCHSLAAATEAERSGVSYIIFGPVFATPSKAAYGSPQGLDRLAEVCRSLRIPVLVIGGITVENTAECLAAGAAGIAAIRLFQESPDLVAVVRRFRSRL